MLVLCASVRDGSSPPVYWSGRVWQDDVPEEGVDPESLARFLSGMVEAGLDRRYILNVVEVVPCTS